MVIKDPCYVGIDIAMEWIDVGLYPADKVRRFANKPYALADLLEWLKGYDVAKIVIEATGGLEYLAAQTLKAAGFAVAVVNPARTAAFRRVAGRITKTDAVDARLFALYAARMNPEAGGVPDERQKQLKELIARRRQLVGLLVQERNRLASAYETEVKLSLQATITMLTRERTRIETLLVKAIEASPDLAEPYRLLKTIPAIGPIVAATLITELPELGRLTPKEIASLAGLAPHNKDSGKTRGVASIQGGRACVRAALYMSAIVASRRNPVMKETYQRLLTNGKPKKLALVAIMRKLVIVANQIVKTNRPWQEDYQQTA